MLQLPRFFSRYKVYSTALGFTAGRKPLTFSIPCEDNLAEGTNSCKVTLTVWFILIHYWINVAN